MRRRAARTRSCRCRSSGPRGPCPARCSACSRSTRSPVVERVDGQLALVDVGVDTSASVQSASGFACQSSCRSSQPSFGGAGAGRRLLAAHAGDPAVEPGERAARAAPTLRIAQQSDGLRSHSASPWIAAWRPSDGPSVDLDLDPVALLDLAPDVVGLGEEDVGVEREDARVGRAPSSMSSRTDSSCWNEQASESLGWKCSTITSEHLGCGQRLDVGVADEGLDAPSPSRERYH